MYPSCHLLRAGLDQLDVSMEGIAPVLEKITPTQKMIFGQPYEVVALTSTSPSLPMHEITIEDIPHVLEKIATTQKIISGQPYEVTALTSASPSLPIQETAVFVSPKSVLLQKIEAPTNAAPCLPLLEETTKLIFGETYKVGTHEDVAPSSAVPSAPFKPRCPLAHNTRSKAKKMHVDNL